MSRAGHHSCHCGECRGRGSSVYAKVLLDCGSHPRRGIALVLVDRLPEILQAGRLIQVVHPPWRTVIVRHDEMDHADS